MNGLRGRRFTGRLSLLAAAVVIAVPIRTMACPVCVPLPTKTAADLLIESQDVVFAGVHPDRPFSCQVAEFVKGRSDGQDIDHFVDSVTRRRLTAHPDHVIVLVRPQPGAEWRRLGVADREYQQIIQRIVVESPQWTTARDGAARRYAYFQTLFGNPNRAIFELAYLELGRAPYETIQQLGRRVSREDLTPMLTRRAYLKWRSLAILLLAQNADADAQRLITQSFNDCQQYSIETNLAAWAIAAVEVSGVDAVRDIETHYLQNADRTDEEIRAILTALLVHSQTPQSCVRNRLAGLFRTARQHHEDVVVRLKQESADWNLSVDRGVFSESDTGKVSATLLRSPKNEQNALTLKQ